MFDVTLGLIHCYYIIVLYNNYWILALLPFILYGTIKINFIAPDLRSIFLERDIFAFHLLEPYHHPSPILNALHFAFFDYLVINLADNL